MPARNFECTSSVYFVRPYLPLYLRQLVSWVLSLVAVDVLLLLVWSLTDRPRKVTLVQYVDGIGEGRVSV